MERPLLVDGRRNDPLKLLLNDLNSPPGRAVAESESSLNFDVDGGTWTMWSAKSKRAQFNSSSANAGSELKQSRPSSRAKASASMYRNAMDSFGGSEALMLQ